MNALSAGEAGGATGFSFFRISVDLTELGLEHVDDVITSVFQYLAMLRTGVHSVRASPVAGAGIAGSVENIAGCASGIAGCDEKTSGADARIYKELQALESIRFRFKDKENPISYVSSVASCLQVALLAYTVESPY